MLPRLLLPCAVAAVAAATFSSAWPSSIINDPRLIFPTNDTLAQEADQLLLQLSTLSPRYSIAWLMDIYDPIPLGPSPSLDLPAHRYLRTVYASSGAAFAFGIRQRNCDAVRALRRGSQYLADELDHFFWLEHRCCRTVQSGLFRQILSRLHCFLRRHLVLFLTTIPYSQWVAWAQALAQRQRLILSSYLDQSPTLFAQYEQIQTITSTYRSHISESLDFIAARIMNCHRFAPEAACRSKFVGDIEALYQSKAWVDWLELNAVVSYQRWSAMSFFALQMRETLDRLMDTVTPQRTDFDALHTLIKFLQRLNQPSSNGPTLLHTLGYRAGLYASQHWAHQHDKPRTRTHSPSHHHFDFPTTALLNPAPFGQDFLTCLRNFRKALAISSDHLPLPDDHRGELTCPTFLSLQRNRHWVFQYFSKLELSTDETPNGAFHLPIPVPSEPLDHDWNCHRGASLPLSAKGLRMGNIPHGRKREWIMFKKQSNGERCLVWEDEENDMDAWGWDSKGGDRIWCLVRMLGGNGVWASAWKVEVPNASPPLGNETDCVLPRERYRRLLWERRRRRKEEEGEGKEN